MSAYWITTLNLACLVCLIVYSARKQSRRFFSHKLLIGNNTWMYGNMKFILNVDQDIARLGKVNELDILFNTVLFYTKHFVRVF